MENIVSKGEIACNEQFLLFWQCFLPYVAFNFHVQCTLKQMLSAICFNLDQSKNLSSGYEFKLQLGFGTLMLLFTCTSKYIEEKHSFFGEERVRKSRAYKKSKFSPFLALFSTP